jgi:hypothetical protein
MVCNKNLVMLSLMNKINACLLLLLFAGAFMEIPSVSALIENQTSEDPWTTSQPISAKGSDFKAGVVNNIMYIINSGVTYQYTGNLWLTKKPMPTDRDGFGLAVVENKIYCIGGRTSGGPSAANEAYDSALDSWETKTAIPTPRHFLDANVVNGKIYLISGDVPDDRWAKSSAISYSNYKLTNVTEVFDPASDSWTTKAPIPRAVSFYASAVVGNKIYIISGDFTQIYDAQTDKWSYGTPPPHAVNMAGCATIAGLNPPRIFVIGGRHELEEAYNQVYDVENDSWSIGAPLPTARYGLATAVVDGKIFAIGGTQGSFSNVVQLDVNEVYDPLKDASLLFASPSPSPTTPQSGLNWLEITATAVVCSIGAVLTVGLVLYCKKRGQSPKN